eukprot:11162549-Lingulodinium_polyedra.AAC.1
MINLIREGKPCADKSGQRHTGTRPQTRHGRIARGRIARGRIASRAYRAADDRVAGESRADEWPRGRIAQRTIRAANER